MADTKTKTDTTAKAADGKTASRKQISKLIGINLSVSRVRGHLDKRNINASIEAALAELRPVVASEKDGKKVDLASLSDATKEVVASAYATVYGERKSKRDDLVARLTKSKKAADKQRLKDLPAFPARTNTAAEQLDYVSKLRCRFSNEASVVLASALDYLVQDLVRTAMVNARARGKAIIKVCHVLQDGFDDVEMAPLVRNLDVVQSALGGDVDEKEDDTVDGDDEKEAEEGDDDSKKSSFKFYVNQICKSVKAELVAKDDTYTPVRISQEIRRFGSDVVIQMIQRVSPLIKMYTETADIKTVNDKVVNFIFNLLLTDARRDTTAFNKFVSERLVSFRDTRK